VSFKFVDLFAGIGGFHAVLHGLGGECVYAIEIDPKSAEVYERNWKHNPIGDITHDVSDSIMNVPPHDVLVAGFPCQPFSKSGLQGGMEETRGTLYWNILRIITERRPAMVFLENVRNISGPRHIHEWRVIIETLRAQGYTVCDKPAIFSPHLLPPEHGGRPQFRERVFIVAVRDDDHANNQLLFNAPVVANSPFPGWDPNSWHLERDLPLENQKVLDKYSLSIEEVYWIDAWDDFVVNMREIRNGQRLPGFPLWGDEWRLETEVRIDKNVPLWKADYLRKNANFYSEHQAFIDFWAKKWDFYGNKFPKSRRKLEWQAQDTPSLWETILHFRPSGIRAKRSTHVPALVAITQTSIIGSQKRRLSPRECARLQGFPDWFDFGDQSDAASYKQLGNSISVGAVWYVFKQAVNAYSEILNKTCPQLVEKVRTAATNPDDVI
jgi:DNA (cytosine-5)-methyltransferase 1